MLSPASPPKSWAALLRTQWDAFETTAGGGAVQAQPWLESTTRFQIFDCGEGSHSAFNCNPLVSSEIALGMRNWL